MFIRKLTLLELLSETEFDISTNPEVNKLKNWKRK